MIEKEEKAVAVPAQTKEDGVAEEGDQIANKSVEADDEARE